MNKICVICNKAMSAGHTYREHKLKYKDYYDTYLKSNNDGICVVCGKPTVWDRTHYKETCSKQCAARNPARQEKIRKTNLERYGVENVYQIESIKQRSIETNRNKSNECLYCHTPCGNKYFCSDKCKNLYKESGKSYNNREQAKQTCIEQFNGKMNSGAWETRRKNIEYFAKLNNCTSIKTLVQKYGQGWLKLNLPKIMLNRQNSFISNEYIPSIEDYISKKHVNLKSNFETYIMNNLYYTGKITHNNRRIISPKELDIYLPDLKLAIEFNGTYWHAEERQNNIFIHREKSIDCHNLGIRLIHIFEFEDLDEQIYKVNQLINGTDLFEQTFTKNSLLDIPTTDPTIIYKDDKNTIYSA